MYAQMRRFAANTLFGNQERPMAQRRQPPPRPGSNGAASRAPAASSSPSTTRKKPVRRSLAARLAEAEAKIQRLRDEGLREQTEPVKDDEIVYATLQKVRLFRHAVQQLKEMGLDEASCEEALVELQAQIDERMKVLKENPKLYKERPKKKKGEAGTVSAAADGDDDADETDVGPFP